jgi:hypothetical protein
MISIKNSRLKYFIFYVNKHRQQLKGRKCFQN